MEDVRDGDLRVPLISSLFFVLVIIGGIFLTFYVFLPSIAQPWFPVVAFLLIGSPWAFWMLTYLYTCFKGTCCPREISYPYDVHQNYSRRGGPIYPMPPRQNAMISSQDQATGRPLSKDKPPQPQPQPQPSGATNVVGSRHVHFGEVVVVESDGSKVIHEMDSWTNPSKLVVMAPPKARSS
ncbi:unnamed protein product [Lactuca virosa]|uniref:Transmembrane protein n=1 Tax=Lactuca virosa TaxID=75947 RepID=A0AAU9PFM2_9ASTR|nr:unnamed protein product [Lactuca virosa]